MDNHFPPPGLPPGPPPDAGMQGSYPLAPGPLQPSVTAPLNSAFDLIRTTCFDPFDIGRWIVLGFLAWLTDLARSGIPMYTGNWGGGGGRGAPRNQDIQEATEWLSNHAGWVAAGILFSVILAYAFMLLVYWLRSRGDFAFLHNLAHNSAEIAGPWTAYAREGNSLFLLRGGIYTAGFVIGLIGLGILGVVGYSDLANQSIGTPTIVVGIIFALIAVILGIAAAILAFIIDDFVVPIMYAQRCTAMEGLKEARALMTANFGTFFLYWLMRIALALGVGAILGVLGCICCCILIVPVLRCVFLLPIFVFMRGYSAYFIDQFGPRYRIFPDTLYFDLGSHHVPMPPMPG